jgi:hypothetical protein
MRSIFTVIKKRKFSFNFFFSFNFKETNHKLLQMCFNEIKLKLGFKYFNNYSLLIAEGFGLSPIDKYIFDIKFKYEF